MGIPWGFHGRPRVSRGVPWVSRVPLFGFHGAPWVSMGLPSHTSLHNQWHSPIISDTAGKKTEFQYDRGRKGRKGRKGATSNDKTPVPNRTAEEAEEKKTH